MSLTSPKATKPRHLRHIWIRSARKTPKTQYYQHSLTPGQVLEVLGGVPGKSRKLLKDSGKYWTSWTEDIMYERAGADHFMVLQRIPFPLGGSCLKHRNGTRNSSHEVPKLLLVSAQLVNRLQTRHETISKPKSKTSKRKKP